MIDNQVAKIDKIIERLKKDEIKVRAKWKDALLLTNKLRDERSHIETQLEVFEVNRLAAVRDQRLRQALTAKEFTDAMIKKLADIAMRDPVPDEQPERKSSLFAFFTK